MSGRDMQHAEKLIQQWSTLEWAVRRLNSRSRARRSERVDDTTVKKRIIAVPQLKTVSWDDYKQRMGTNVPDEHFAIEILPQDPRITRGPQGRRHTKLGKSELVPNIEKNGVQLSSPIQLESPHHRLDVKFFPSRIRINSLPGKRILDGLVDNVLKFSGMGGKPLVLTRPYKLLVHIEQDIREKLSKMEEDHEKMQKEGNWGKAFDQSDRRDSRFSNCATFFMPFEWSVLTESESTEAIDDFRCIVTFIDTYITPLRKCLKDPYKVHFGELWHLFPQGSCVYVRDKSVHQKLWRVTQAVGGRKYLDMPEGSKKGSWEDKSSSFSLNCYYLDFDGTRFLRVFRNFFIEPFSELQSVSLLPLIPIKVAERENLVQRDAVMARSNQFLDCTKPVCRYYEGRSLSLTPLGEQLQKPNPNGLGLSRVYSETIESQVMVDFERGVQAMPDWNPSNFLNDGEPVKVDDAEIENVDEHCDDDRVWDAKMREEFLEDEEVKWQKWDREGEQPSGDDLLLLPDRVFAFVFRTRTWGEFQKAERLF